MYKSYELCNLYRFEMNLSLVGTARRPGLNGKRKLTED